MISDESDGSDWNGESWSNRDDSPSPGAINSRPVRKRKKAVYADNDDEDDDF